MLRMTGNPQDGLKATGNSIQKLPRCGRLGEPEKENAGNLGNSRKNQEKRLKNQEKNRLTI